MTVKLDENKSRWMRLTLKSADKESTSRISKTHRIFSHSFWAGCLNLQRRPRLHTLRKKSRQIVGSNDGFVAADDITQAISELLAQTNTHT